jgi:hypothetical protein
MGAVEFESPHQTAESLGRTMRYVICEGERYVSEADLLTALAILADRVVSEGDQK